MQRKKRLVLSGDFDSCFDVFSPLAFDNPVIFSGEESPAEQERILKLTRDRVATAKASLDHLLETMTANYDEDAVELYVASFRQSRALNWAYMSENGNGCCYKTYTDLCKEKNWTFRKLLLADTQNGYPAGTAMNDDTVHAKLSPSKLNILLGHINDAKLNHPNDIFDFCFFDDDTENKFIPEIQQYFAKHPLPKHINSLKLVRYDWFETVNKNQPAIMNITTIQQPMPKSILIDLKNTAALPSFITVKELKKPQPRVYKNIRIDLNHTAALPSYITVKELKKTQPPVSKNIRIDLNNKASLPSFITVKELKKPLSSNKRQHDENTSVINNNSTLFCNPQNSTVKKFKSTHDNNQTSIVKSEPSSMTMRK